MTNIIQFNDGKKRYQINDDPNKVICFNPSDFDILNRFNTAYKNVQQIYKDMQENDFKITLDGTLDENTIGNIEEVAKVITSFEKKIRENIDYILGSPVCDIAFGNQSCISMVGGIPLYERFLNAIMPIIEKDIKAEQEKSKKRVEKYTKAVKK